MVGLVPGEVEVSADGAGLHIEPVADDLLDDEDGLLVIPAGEVTVSGELVRMLRNTRPGEPSATVAAASAATRYSRLTRY
jgi:hypothetical protein